MELLHLPALYSVVRLVRLRSGRKQHTLYEIQYIYCRPVFMCRQLYEIKDVVNEFKNTPGSIQNKRHKREAALKRNT